MILVPPNHQVVINNSDAMFVCVSLVVFPQYQISWVFINHNERETEIIQTQGSGNSSKYRINRESGTTRFGTLTIVNATFGDRGTYRCNASNEIGYAEASANLIVQGNMYRSNRLISTLFSIHSAPHYWTTFKQHTCSCWQ